MPKKETADKQVKKRKFKCPDLPFCPIEEKHSHCNECGSTLHGAAYCDAEDGF